MRFGVVGAGRVDRGALADGLGHLSCRTGISEIGNRKALAGRVDSGTGAASLAGQDIYICSRGLCSGFNRLC